MGNISNFIDKIDLEKFVDQTLPVEEILKESLFYPASGVDGSPIMHWDLGVRSFVYVDITLDENSLNQILKNAPPRGYKAYIRDVKEDELRLQNWQPSSLSISDPMRYMAIIQEAGINKNSTYAKWVVFKRNVDLTDAHGPDRFCLLFIRGEGIASYQALYTARKILPKIVAIIRPGTGWGGNFNSFENDFLKEMSKHPKGLPGKLLYWHFSNQCVLENPWAEPDGPYNKDRISGPFPKSGEPDFSISLFKLK